MKYRKKPVEIEAIAWDGKNTEEIIAFVGKGIFRKETFSNTCLVIPTLEGDHLARVGDFIIKGVKGEFYPCKPDIFKLTYEVLGEKKEV